jgi:hypothetical protein
MQGKQPNSAKRFALMIRYNNHNQSCLPGFEQFFGVPLDKENRWIKLSGVIPWDEFTEAYYQNMNSGMGRPAKDARLVIGAVIVKHKLCLSDEETTVTRCCQKVFFLRKISYR